MVDRVLYNRVPAPILSASAPFAASTFIKNLELSRSVEDSDKDTEHEEEDKITSEIQVESVYKPGLSTYKEIVTQNYEQYKNVQGSYR